MCAAAIAGIAAIRLSADGGSDSSSNAPAPPKVTPASADVISGPGFQFSAPEGWTDAKDADPSAIALAANKQDTDGFADNVNVIFDPTIVGAAMDKLEKSIEQVLKRANAKDVEVGDPIDVDSEEAARISAVFELNGNSYRTEQFAVDHDGKGYIVTFSFSMGVSKAQRDDLALASLKTWRWGDVGVPSNTTAPSTPERSPEAEPPGEPDRSQDDVPAQSRSQQNAILAAERYLDYSPFSKAGLAKQLKYEGFSDDDATNAVESLDADWNEQAAKSAERYLDYSAFSRSGLIQQLKYEGFTEAEATFGVDQTGL